MTKTNLKDYILAHVITGGITGVPSIEYGMCDKEGNNLKFEDIPTEIHEEMNKIQNNLRENYKKGNKIMKDNDDRLEAVETLWPGLHEGITYLIQGCKGDLTQKEALEKWDKWRTK